MKIFDSEERRGFSELSERFPVTIRNYKQTAFWDVTSANLNILIAVKYFFDNYKIIKVNQTICICAINMEDVSEH